MIIAMMMAAAVNAGSLQPPEFPIPSKRSNQGDNTQIIYFGPAKPYAEGRTEDLRLSIYPTGCLIGIRHHGSKVMHCLIAKNGHYPDSELGAATLEFNDVPMKP
jgi:hypothetical protein